MLLLGNGENCMRLLICLTGAFLGLPLFWAGCVVNPITGESQFSLISQADEKALGQQAAPQQIQADAGVVGDAALNAYVNGVGQKLAAVSHRPDWGYSFQVVNATYVNAYAFPDGTICITRGMMMELKDEAQLAAVLGHEIGHVCARHSAQQQTQAILLQGASLGIAGAFALSDKLEDYALAAGVVSSIASQTWLAKYSRTDESQSDELGLDYMRKAGYDPQAMVELMEILMRAGGSNPSLLEQMFATHPMSSDRRDAVEKMLRGGKTGGNRNAAAFQRAVAGLNAQAPALKAQQQAQALAAKGNAAGAASLVKRAYGGVPSDPSARLALAQYQLQAGDYAGAAVTSRQALASAPRNRELLAIGIQATLHLKNYTEALGLITRLEQAFGAQHAGLMYARAVCNRGLGKPVEAAAACRKGLQLEPNGAYSARLQTLLNEVTR